MSSPLHIVRNNLMGANVARRQIGDGGVNGVIMPDGSELGFKTPIVTDVGNNSMPFVVVDYNNPNDMAVPPPDPSTVPRDYYITPPQSILATSIPGNLPTGRTTGIVGPRIKPVRTDQLYTNAPGPDPILSTGPPYVPPGDIIPGTNNPLLWSNDAGPAVGSPVGTPAPPPVNPVGNGAVQGTPYATPVITAIPPTPTVDPLTGAVTGTPVDTSHPVSTVPSSIALTPATTTATTGTAYITIFGINIPVWLLWVLGIGGVLWYLFGGNSKGRR